MDLLQNDQIVLDIALACLVPAGTGSRLHKNRPTHGIALHTSGCKIYHFAEGEDLRVGANDLIFLPQGSSYRVEDEEAGDCYAINFTVAGEEVFPPFTMHLKNAGDVLRAFQNAERVFSAKRTGCLTQCRAALYTILYAMMREKEQGYSNQKMHRILHPALQKIHATYTTHVPDIDSLAALSQVSPAYFRRVFLQCFGMSPVKYINRLRLARAKELLAQSECTVESVAELAGFHNVYYFCRFFKKETGMTPTTSNAGL